MLIHSIRGQQLTFKENTKLRNEKTNPLNDITQTPKHIARGNLKL